MGVTQNGIIILGIESSCDDTGAAIIQDGFLLSNCVANQQIHEAYGGVIPELASRAHQQNILPVVDQAIRRAKITKNQISAIAYTRGPGLIGSLLVGSSFAKGLALALEKPLIEVNHMQGHILAHLISDETQNKQPNFPFICLTVSGGHTQLVVVRSPTQFEIIGETIDDAAGEAFDKSAKLLGLPYPGGPLIDQLAQTGNPLQFKFSQPQVNGLNFSFSGLKTNIMYFLKAETSKDPQFIANHLPHLAASIQFTIIDILLKKLKAASQQTGIKNIALAGGVSANKGLRAALVQAGQQHNWQVFIPPFAYCTDNAAMIAITGYYKYLAGDLSNQGVSASARYPL